MEKERLDVLLVKMGFFTTRERAKAAIMTGNIFINEEMIDKPGTKVDVHATIRVKGEAHPYVSRGGLKLEKAIGTFQLKLDGKIMIDIGASTGGFTDCALQNGASKVYAIDVGYGQLAWKLRNDPRVVVMERTNFRYLDPNSLTEGKPNFATIDVSFISLKIILPHLVHFLQDNSDVVALVKPQFEAGKEQVGKNGIVRDPKVHTQVLQEIIAFAEQHGYQAVGLTFSPIQGGEGNIEFLLHLRYKSQFSKPLHLDIKQFVNETHEYFSNRNHES